MAAESDFRTGVVITTHGKHYELVKACLVSVLENTPYPRHIMVMDNESEDDRTKKLGHEFSEITYVRYDDQHDSGGLTRTWNDGIVSCLNRECDVIVLLNHDTQVYTSWTHLLEAAAHGAQGPFGPMSDNPGMDEHGLQVIANAAECPARHTVVSHPCTGLAGVNGFCLAASASTFKDNAFDVEHGLFFDPKFPFGGNENEWHLRWSKREGSQFHIVKSAFVSHQKLREWKKIVPTVNFFCVAIGGDREMKVQTFVEHVLTNNPNTVAEVVVWSVRKFREKHTTWVTDMDARFPSRLLLRKPDCDFNMKAKGWSNLRLLMRPKKPSRFVYNGTLDVLPPGTNVWRSFLPAPGAKKHFVHAMVDADNVLIYLFMPYSVSARPEILALQAEERDREGRVDPLTFVEKIEALVA